MLRCFDRDYGTVEYEVSIRDRRSRGMAGAGVLALAHAGHHRSYEAQAAGDWMYQLGGKHWAQFYPGASRTLLDNQFPNGSWPADANMNDGKFGNAYTTALAILALSVPNQLLPIFQR